MANTIAKRVMDHLGSGYHTERSFRLLERIALIREKTIKGGDLYIFLDKSMIYSNSEGFDVCVCEDCGANNIRKCSCRWYD